MSADTDESGDDDPTGPVEITLTLGEESDRWVARDEETGVTTQGETRQDALENLDDAVALYRGEIGRSPTEDELRAAGIDPDANTSGELQALLE